MAVVRRAVSRVALYLIALALGAWAATPLLEERIARRLKGDGAPAGLGVGAVRFSWVRPLRLESVTMTRDGAVLARADRVDVTWSLAGGRDPRAHVRGVAVHGVHLAHGRLSADLPEGRFDLVSWSPRGGGTEVRLRQPSSGGGIDIGWPGRGSLEPFTLSLKEVDLASLRLAFAGQTVLELGLASGQLALATAGEETQSRGDLRVRGARVTLPASLDLGATGPGAPSTLAAEWDLTRSAKGMDVRRATLTLGGLDVRGRGHARGVEAERMVDAFLAVQGELGAALRSFGLRLPASVPTGADGPLGKAALELSVRGLLARPAELRIVPRLAFEAAPEAVASLSFLTRSFRLAPEGARAIEVRAESPDFIPIGSVPPLFTRTLLIAEDAGFFGHPGIDVAEIPAAWAENVEKGEFARGASTITQQLVKNLFLSREKSYGRKIEEAALALVVDAALPKSRILEIYVNVIEWGPNLYGLLPASRHYFGKPPTALTAKEIAFLVCLIPSPVRYHQAHLAGRPGPGMEQLMANLLVKLHSVGALDDQALQDALFEELRFRPEGA